MRSDCRTLWDSRSLWNACIPRIECRERAHCHYGYSRPGAHARLRPHPHFETGFQGLHTSVPWPTTEEGYRKGCSGVSAFCPKQVHGELKDLTSKSNILNTFRPTKIKIGLEQILRKYTMIFIEQSEVGTSRHNAAHGSEYSHNSSIIELEKAQKDLSFT